MSLFSSFPILSFLIWLPISSGFFFLTVYLKNFFSKNIIYNLVLLISFTSVLLSFYLFYCFDKNLTIIQFSENICWLPFLGINYTLGIDGFSLPFIMLTCLMTFLVIVYSFFDLTIDNKVVYFSCFLIMQGLMCGVFMALDSILFYIFFEAMLIPMFLIIGLWGGFNRIYATLKFFLYTFFGSVFLLLAIIFLHYVALREGYALDKSFNIFVFQNLNLTLIQQKLLFFAFLLAFSIKIPMWPVHTWLPDAHVEAPTGGSVILAAITLKIGGYGMLRFLLAITPDACFAYSSVMIYLSLIAILYIGFVALAQTNMKKIIAYSSISHMGFVTLGFFLIFKFFDALFDDYLLFDSILSLQGALFQMISHGFIAGALFFCVGVLYERLHTKEISDFGGVANVMPVFSIFFLIFALANTGLPGLSGFVGEFFIIISSYKVSFWLSFFVSITLILSAAYTLWLYKRVMFGVVKHDHVLMLTNLTFCEWIVFFFLVVFIIFLGMYPDCLLSMMNCSVENLIYHIFRFR